MTAVEKKATRKARKPKSVTPLWTGTEWNPAMLERVYAACEKIAVGEMGLDIYRNQIEVISSEQMLDAYSSIGMPIFYNHWSFGKSFSREADAYKAGKRGLAYELVINSNPCINYLMEENTATTQALVIAHAAFGHNCFSDDTEILTASGWKGREGIGDGEVVATINRETLAVEYHPIDQKFEYDFDGEMCRFQSSCMDHLVTPNHKMVFVSARGNFTETDAQDWTQTGTSAIVSGLYDRPDNAAYTDDELRLLVWCVADGHLAYLPTSMWSFHFKKARKIERLTALLRRLDVGFRSTSNPATTKIRCNLPDAKFAKVLPINFMVSARQFEVMAEEWMHTDGSIRVSEREALSGSIFTSLRSHVDKVQELAAISGAKTCYTLNEKTGVYTVQIRLSKSLVQQSRSPMNGMETYEGKVWCVSVQNHTLISRRNGRILVTGNSFFKTNYLFKTWTDADSIVDYLVFARDYVSQCEERHGQEQVELYLDSIHALSDYGVDRYKRPAKLSAAQEKERVREREAYLQSRVSTLYGFDAQEAEKVAAEPPWPAQPEENILYFIEKNAPDLKGWQRELIRIVRKINQYFYPQGQTKLMNEGFASWIHYTIMNTLHDRGLTTDGAHLEFLHLHSSVLFQPGFNDPRYGGLNPYKLGFDMLIDIERICREPTEEDRRWFPALIGQDPLEIIKDAVANYRDESFVRQFLSPHLIRQWKMFRVHDKRDSPFYEVQAIHNDRGYHDIRDSLADSYEWHAMRPQIEVTRANRRTRALTLTHTPYRGRSLANPEAVMRHIRHLWGYPVELRDNHDWLISEIK